MDFISPRFLFLFLPIFILIYSFLPGRFKLAAGVAGSLVFYAWRDAHYLPWMAGLVLFAYSFGRLLDWKRSSRFAPVFLWCGILLVVLSLIYFKLHTDIPYPLGLSYVAFQVIAYFTDTQKDSENFEQDFLKFAFYLLFFPKLPVGPIVPYRQVRLQIHGLKSDPAMAANGFRRFLLGFVKKVLIADTLGTVVAPIFALPSPVVAPVYAWLAIVAFSLQLYYDFSGFTDMAIGLGNMMGLRLMENFNMPYLSRSIGEFWRRWHISLSTWFREVVFFPLERRRFNWHGQQVNIMIVFVLTGLWHGFTWNFFFWGVLHGGALVLESTALGRKIRGLWIPLQHIYALSVIMIGWVVFRSPTPDFALDYLRRLAGDIRGVQVLPFETTSPLPLIEPTFILVLIIALLGCLPWGGWLWRLSLKVNENMLWRFTADLSLVLVFLVALGSAASATYQPGIYGGF